MSSPQALQVPTVEQVGDGAKALVAISALVGGAWAIARKWHRGRQQRRRREALEAKAIRYVLDSDRHVLHVLQLLLRGGGYRVTQEERDEIARQLVLISDVREELWIADGFQSRRDVELIERQIVKELTRTQRIKALPDQSGDQSQ